jgi:hypothetical protein
VHCHRNSSTVTVIPHDFGDVVEMFVEEAFLVMREAPFRHDAAATADDAGHALGGEREASIAYSQPPGSQRPSRLGQAQTPEASQYYTA